jgi:hypothetical protein
METNAYPAETVEGWYALHQVFTTDWPAIRALDASRDEIIDAIANAMITLPSVNGASVAGLKFADALPPDLATATIAERLEDQVSMTYHIYGHRDVALRLVERLLEIEGVRTVVRR